MGKEITLYHSTDQRSFDMAQEAGSLLGMRSVDGSQTLSNLTTSKSASQRFILIERSGRWTVSEGPPTLVTLEFSVPEEMVEEVGLTYNYGCPEYATTFPVQAFCLPDEYLEYIHAGTRPITRKYAEKLERNGEVAFYELPMTYLVASELIDY